MDLFGAAVSTLISVAAFGLFAAGVLKLFQIHALLGEIKDLLQGVRATPGALAGVPARATTAPEKPIAPTALHEMGSGEAMLRALDAQIHLEEATKALNPEIVERKDS